MKRLILVALSGLFFLGTIALYLFITGEVTKLVNIVETAKAKTLGINKAHDLALANAQFISETATSRAEFENFIVKDADVVKLVEAVETAAKRERVSANIVSVNVVPGSWKYHESLQMNIAGKGSFAALSAFLSDVEALPLASRLDNATFTAADAGWLGTFTVEFVKGKSMPPQTP